MQHGEMFTSQDCWNFVPGIFLATAQLLLIEDGFLFSDLLCMEIDSALNYCCGLSISFLGIA